jgi:ankyrin repeat protein
MHQYIDLNARDSEGTVPICFSYRSNSAELIDILIQSPSVDLNLSSPKYGCPLHLCILKHKFGQALYLLDVKKVNPHTLNPNGSNALHILFANFQYDNHAESLASKLAKK